MPTTPVIVGDPQPALQRYVETWSPNQGYRRSIEYEGHSTEYMRAVMSQYLGSKWEVRLTLLPDVAQLEVSDPSGGSDPSGNVTIDKWEITQSDLNTSSLQNPRNQELGTNDLKVIGRTVDMGGTFDQAIAAMAADGLGTFDKPTSAAALRLFDRMKNGATHYISSRYILKHTTNAPLYHAGVNIADQYVDLIYDLNELFNETQNASFWLLPMPNTFATAINNITFPEALLAYQNGALKRGASRSSNADSRQDIVTEYWFGQWSTDEYGSR